MGREALLGAVRACWASLWTDRAVAYRDRLGIDHRTARMAVVVQRLVPAEFAGVMFTANRSAAHGQMSHDTVPAASCFGDPWLVDRAPKAPSAPVPPPEGSPQA